MFNSLTSQLTNEVSTHLAQEGSYSRQGGPFFPARLIYDPSVQEVGEIADFITGENTVDLFSNELGFTPCSGDRVMIDGAIKNIQRITEMNDRYIVRVVVIDDI